MVSKDEFLDVKKYDTEGSTLSRWRRRNDGSETGRRYIAGEIGRGNGRGYLDLALRDIFVHPRTVVSLQSKERGTLVISPHTFAKKSKVAFGFHFLFSPSTNTSINCPNTVFSVNPSTPGTFTPVIVSIRGLFAKFDKNIQTKSAC